MSLLQKPIIGQGSGPVTQDPLFNNLKQSHEAELNTGFESWAAGGPYWSITDDNFTVLVAGTGYINGVRISWTQNQSVSLQNNVTNFVYVNSSEVLSVTSTVNENLYRNNVMLFEVYRDSNDIDIVVKENHPYSFDTSESIFLHNTVGTVFDRETGGEVVKVGTGNGGDPADRMFKIVGNTVLYDHGLNTFIPDSNNEGVDVYWVYKNASGHWQVHSYQKEHPAVWNNNGVIENIPTGGDRFSVSTIYASKDNLNTNTPVYFGVINTSLYGNIGQATTAANTNDVTKIDGELAKLEVGELAKIVIRNSNSGADISNVVISKTVLNSANVVQSTSTTGNTVSLETTNFDKILSSTDSNVQLALETLDEHSHSGLKSNVDVLIETEENVIIQTNYDDDTKMPALVFDTIVSGNPFELGRIYVDLDSNSLTYDVSTSSSGAIIHHVFKGSNPSSKVQISNGQSLRFFDDNNNTGMISVRDSSNQVGKLQIDAELHNTDLVLNSPSFVLVKGLNEVRNTIVQANSIQFLDHQGMQFFILQGPAGTDTSNNTTNPVLLTSFNRDILIKFIDVSTFQSSNDFYLRYDDNYDMSNGPKEAIPSKGYVDGNIVTERNGEYTVETEDELETVLVQKEFADDSIKTVNVYITGFEPATSDTYWRQLVLGVKCLSGTLSIIGGVGGNVGYDTTASEWSTDASTTDNKLLISVFGEETKTIQWKAFVEVI